LVPPKTGLFILKKANMFEKKINILKSPDLSKLKEVVIDHRTKIYIAHGADAEEARTRYLSKISARKLK
jgi:hypothetical protein